MPRDRNLYRATYKSGATIREESIPIIRHLHDDAGDWEAYGAELLAQGTILRGGVEMQYQDVRIFVRPKE